MSSELEYIFCQYPIQILLIKYINEIFNYNYEYIQFSLVSKYFRYFFNEYLKKKLKYEFDEYKGIKFKFLRKKLTLNNNFNPSIVDNYISKLADQCFNDFGFSPDHFRCDNTYIETPYVKIYDFFDRGDFNNMTIVFSMYDNDKKTKYFFNNLKNIIKVIVGDDKVNKIDYFINKEIFFASIKAYSCVYIINKNGHRKLLGEYRPVDGCKFFEYGQRPKFKNTYFLDEIHKFTKAKFILEIEDDKYFEESLHPIKLEIKQILLIE